MDDIKDILNKIGYTNLKESSIGQYSTRPLYRHSDNDTALTINKRTGEFFDFVTKQGGSLQQLIKLSLNLPSDVAVEEFCRSSFFTLPILSHSIELHEQQIFDKNLLLKLKKDNSYWNNRGISDNTLDHFQGGVAVKGRMMNRYVFPIFNYKEDLVGFAGRMILDNSLAPKWKILGAKSKWIYPSNEIHLKIKKSVILVESIGNLLSLWEAGIHNVLVSFGTSLSPCLVAHLLKLDIKNIIISFDNDENNNFVGNNASVDAKNLLLKFFDFSQVKICLPTEKDFGEMSREQINLWVNKC